MFTVTQAAPPCAFTISPASVALPVSGGPSNVAVTTGSGCSWTATSGASWVSISNGTGRVGSGSVSFTAAANTTATPRSATLTVAGQAFVVTEPSASCTFSVSPLLISIPSTATTGTLTVTTQAGCAWTTSTAASWITLTPAGTGSGTVSYTVTANPGTLTCSATISVSGVEITVIQGQPTTPTGLRIVGG